VQGFFLGPLPNPGSPEAMRTQALFIVSAPQKTVQCGSGCVPSPGKQPIYRGPDRIRSTHCSPNGRAAS
jgi:hypothetical protein